jgi:hypothetical protein
MALLLGIVLLLGYWAFLDYRFFPPDRILTPVYFSDEPGGEKQIDFQAGGLVFVNWHLDVLRACNVDFTRSIVNGRSHAIMNLDAEHGVLPSVVGETEFATTLILDELLRPGIYEYRVRALFPLFRCNPLLPFERNYPDVLFNIIEE